MIRNSTFIGNKSRNHGGAVYTYLYTPDTALIEGSYFADNQVSQSPGGRSFGGALVHHQGNLTLRNSTFVNNSAEMYGGAMMIAQSSKGSWHESTVSNVTATNNRADDPKQAKGLGGALFVSGGLVTVENSTLAGNFADTLGGGIYSKDDNVRIRNTIIANNRSGNGTGASQQCYLTFSSSSANLQSPGPGKNCSADAILADPKLADLAQNGGRTMTMALLAGSPAIDRGSNCAASDQRGAARVGRCDIGAFEYGATPSSPEGMTAPSLEQPNTAGPAVRAAWSNVPGATRYEVKVDVKSGLTVQQPNLESLSAALALVLDIGSYDLQVRACNAEGCGPYSNARSVTIDVAPEKIFCRRPC
ncbi:MAG: hypothetical protein HC822_28020 [Oscillochloris sp.]|nr:hypothetical protein [Oscillochloris sp.]